MAASFSQPQYVNFGPFNTYALLGLSWISAALENLLHQGYPDVMNHYDTV